jgi:hypothetical protein
MKVVFSISLVLLYSLNILANTLHVGDGYEFTNISAAAPNAVPGDTILIHEGIYPGGQFITELQGTASQWIYIQNAPGASVSFQGSTEALHFIDAAYVQVSGLIFEQQTGNGVNCDDGGSYDTPSHHLLFDNCIFRNIDASGNNDLLKLSGVDSFEIRNCQFLNGADGGSGIDMVGCHYGTFTGNSFENMGSNSFQVKGGSANIRIERNYFKNGGLRTLNLGGSTGLAYFRPDTAHYEAANIKVYANVIIGSWAAIAYVGSVNVEVVNNTIYQPENWVIRILQETVDPDRFLECGDNSFRNNIIYMNNGLSTETNIGPNTRPETFTFSNNLWYNFENSSWSGPNIPVDDNNGIIGSDPEFMDPDEENFSIASTSPAAGTGIFSGEPVQDFNLLNFANPPSIGAFEANPVNGIHENSLKTLGIKIFPNPVKGHFNVEFFIDKAGKVKVELLDLSGKVIQLLFEGQKEKGNHGLILKMNPASGLYLLNINLEHSARATKVVVFE